MSPIETSDADVDRTGVPAFRPTEATLAAMASVRTLVVPTDADDEGYARARSAAIHLATTQTGTDTRSDAARPGAAALTVVLHDRSDERWTDTPHPEGPFGADEIESDRRPHLVEQVRELCEAGVEAQAWYASIPALTAVLTTVQRLDADAVLVPAAPEAPRMMDRLQPGDDTGDQIGRVLDQQLDRTVFVFVVHDDGLIETLATAGQGETRARPGQT